MSDLDADLYGDLYDNEFADAALGDSETKSTALEPTEPAKSSSTPQTTSTTATAKEPVVKSEPPAPIPTVTTSTPQTLPIPSSASQAPQQIPTYEQQDQSDYSGMGDGGQYQNIPVTERSVRPSEMKDEGKMFIGGLNWDTTDDALREYFEQFGKVDACTIMRDAAGRSRCFAFLTFEDPASVNAVMVREHFLDGKIIDPKRAIPRQEHQRATKLFIGGLPGSVTSDSMREFFSQYGKVIDSTVMLDRETGRSKGFGFISFEDTNVQPILGFGNLEIDGKLIDVKLAQPRYQRDNYQENQGAEYGNQGNARNMAGGQGNFGNVNQAAGAGAGAAGGAMGGAGAGFDPQALAALYTRMMQMANSGAMNPAMMGGMGGMRPGMGMGMGGGMGMGMNPNMGMGGMGGMGMGMGGGNMGMGRGGPGMVQGGGNPAIPRGPRGGSGGPPAVPGANGVGPQRAGQRGQHNYHPYSR